VESFQMIFFVESQSLSTILSFCGVIFLLFESAAEIYEYKDFPLEGHRLVYRSSGLFSPNDAPSKMRPGRGRAFVSINSLKISQIPDENDLTGKNSKSTEKSRIPHARNATLDIAMFERYRFQELGYTIGPTGRSGGVKEYCCTGGLWEANVCDEVGRLIVPKDSPDFQVAKLIVSPVGETHALLQVENFQVQKTAMYALLMANCDEYGQSFIIRGHTVWMNPFGYLPGEWWSDMPFFGIVSLCYLALGALWLVLCFRHCTDLLAIQMWITIVLALGMIETTAKYFDFLAWNEEGKRNMGAMIFGIIMGVFKRTLSRILVLIACLGYGVVKPSLGPTLRRVLLLGTLYFSCSLIYDLMSQLPTSDAELESTVFIDSLTVVVLLTSIVDSLFYLWVFQALNLTIRHLLEKRQSAKCSLYLRFRYVLLVAVLFSISWTVFSIIMSTGDLMETKWKEAWSVNSIWEVMYLAVLLGICFLWRPSANNQRYAYSQQLSTYEEGIELGYGGEESDSDDDEYGGQLPDSEEVLTPANATKPAGTEEEHKEGQKLD